MDYEDFLSEIYTPLKSIELLTDIIYAKCNEDWDIFSTNSRNAAEELFALNYLINLCAKKLLKKRQIALSNL